MTREPRESYKTHINKYSFLLNCPLFYYDAWGLDEGVLDMFLLYLDGDGGKKFSGYSSLIWLGVLQSSEVRKYKAKLEQKARTVYFCCDNDKIDIHSETFYIHEQIGNIFNPLTWGNLLAIGSGWLSSKASTLYVKCGNEKCMWHVNITYELSDLYSFKLYKADGTPDDWWKWDNNWVFRVFLDIDLWGKDFKTVDYKTVEYKGEFRCIPRENTEDNSR